MFFRHSKNARKNGNLKLLYNFVINEVKVDKLWYFKSYFSDEVATLNELPNFFESIFVWIFNNQNTFRKVEPQAKFSRFFFENMRLVHFSVI